MQSKELETKDAGFYARAAAINARLQHAVNATNFTDSQKAKAERMKYALEMVVSAREIYVTCRKKFISVKVDRPGFVRDRKLLALLEGDWAQEGIQKVESAQGFSYRVA